MSKWLQVADSGAIQIQSSQAVAQTWPRSRLDPSGSSMRHERGMDIQQLRRAAHVVRFDVIAVAKLVTKLITSFVERSMDLVRGLHEADLGTGEHRSMRDPVFLTFPFLDTLINCDTLSRTPEVSDDDLSQSLNNSK